MNESGNFDPKIMGCTTELLNGIQQKFPPLGMLKEDILPQSHRNSKAFMWVESSQTGNKTFATTFQTLSPTLVLLLQRVKER